MRTTSSIGPLLLTLLFAANTQEAQAGLYVSISVAPPPLVVYAQPPLPGPDHIWTPGYWSWDEDIGDHYWVPGAWVLAPEPGLLWTPGYWGWNNGLYVWHEGYWGQHVGFYGGVNYGFGYAGAGFEGGYWQGGVFSYNRTVVNVGLSHNVALYSKAVVSSGGTQTSFNGGKGGLQAKPSAQERAFVNERHLSLTGQQRDHFKLAAKDPTLKFGTNRGKPAIAATSKAGDFSKGHTFAAKAAGAGFKPTSLSMPGAGLAGKPSPRIKSKPVSAGAKKFGPAPKQFGTVSPAATSAKTGPASFNAANRFQTTTANRGALPRGAAVQGARRPGPPPRPAMRPLAKAPAAVKKPLH